MFYRARFPGLLSALSCALLPVSLAAAPPVTRASDSTGPIVQLGNTSIVGVSFNYAGTLEQDFFGGKRSLRPCIFNKDC